MRRLTALAILLAVACAASAHAAVPRPALSTTPSPFNWTIPALIPVVGHDANGQPDPRGEIEIIIRDLANNPFPNAVVTLDFSDCADLRLCADPHDPNAVVNCALGNVSKVTDANGAVRFRVVGGSVGTPGQPGTGPNGARVYADGVLGASPTVAIYDLTGFDGLGAGDLAAWLTDYFGGLNPARGDYDNNGIMGASDLGLWLQVYFADGSLSNCSSGGSCGP
jgi:hypothetical protein